MSDLPEGAPAPRLCHLVKWPHFNGYGFNLHADRNKVGQYIGTVDEDSPAESAGLHEGDRIIEVNGVNVIKENHKQVVERIKAVENETRLLVVDMESDKWYSDKKIVVHSSQSNVIYIKAPDPGSIEKENETPNQQDSLDGQITSKPVSNETSLKETSNNLLSEEEKSKNLPKDVSPQLNNDNVEEEEKEHSEKDESRSSTPPTTFLKIEESNGSTGSTASLPESPQSAKSSSSQKEESQTFSKEEKSPVDSNGSDTLNLNMSVSEIKQMLASRKKNDPKKFQMDWHQKYAVMQQM